MKHTIFSWFCALFLALLSFNVWSCDIPAGYLQAYNHPALEGSSPMFGAFVEVGANSYSPDAECDYYKTQRDAGQNLRYPTGKPQDSRGATSGGMRRFSNTFGTYETPSEGQNRAVATLSDFYIGLSRFQRDSGGGNAAKANLTDMIWLENTGKPETESTEIPIKLCGEYSSAFEGSAYALSKLTYIDYPSATGRNSGDFIRWDDESSIRISHSSQTGERCIHGSIVMQGETLLANLRLNAAMNPVATTQSYTYVVDIHAHLEDRYDDYEIDTWLNVKQATFETQFYLDLPEGVICRSASGVFPGCDQPKSNMCDAPAINELAEYLDSVTAEVDINASENILWSGYKFESQFLAVQDAANNIWRRSIFNWDELGGYILNEYAGIIYRKCDSYAYDFKFIPGRKGNISPHPIIISNGGEFVAGWHSHPSFDGIEGPYFSPEDKDWVRAHQKPLWLITPRGDIKICTPDNVDDC